MHALTCGIPPSSVVEIFSTVMNNSGFKSINSISVWISVYRQRYRLSENPKIPISVQHYKNRYKYIFSIYSDCSQTCFCLCTFKENRAIRSAYAHSSLSQDSDKS